MITSLRFVFNSDLVRCTRGVEKSALGGGRAKHQNVWPFFGRIMLWGACVGAALFAKFRDKNGVSPQKNTCTQSVMIKGLCIKSGPNLWDRGSVPGTNHQVPGKRYDIELCRGFGGRFTNDQRSVQKQQYRSIVQWTYGMIRRGGWMHGWMAEIGFVN